MKGVLILLIVIVLGIIVWMATSRGNSTSGSTARENNAAMTCRSDQTVLTGVLGIGVNYSANVNAALKDSEGRTVIPTNREQSEIEGDDFESLSYVAPRVQVGRYTVEITHEGDVIETYTLNLTRSDSPVLTVICP